MIKVINDPKTEAERHYKVTLKHILNGFFIKNNWYSIPYKKLSVKEEGMPIVLLPELEYSDILKDYIGKDFDQKKYYSDYKLLETLEEKIANCESYKPLSKKKFINLEKEIKNKLDETIKKTNRILPYFKDKKINVRVVICQYGTAGSFECFDPNETGDEININIFPRISDNIIDRVIETFSSAITRSFVNKNSNVSWRETEAISDFFSVYVYGAETHLGTLDMVTKVNPVYLKQSLEFLKSNNLPIKGCINYEPEKNQINLISKDISTEFAPYEFRFIRALIKNENSTTTYEDISKEMYNSHADVKFSMWGICKTAQRVKNKLESMGIPRDTIANVRGEGFKFVSSSAF